MTKQAFTDLAIRRLRSQQERFDLWDTNTSGLGLRVFPSGAKSFFMSYRINGERRRDTLGRYPDMRLGDARAKASAMRALLHKDIDPRDEDPNRPLTFGEALPQFITLHCEQKNRPSTIKATRRLLERECLPAWCNRPVAKITRRHINTVLDKVIDRGSTGAANKVRAAMSKFFRWCVSRDYITSSPVDGIEPPSRTNKRNRVLSDQELKAVWQAASATPYPFGPIVRLLLLTAQRRSEVTRMEWHQLDLKKAIWELPGELTKNGEEHHLPLSPLAVSILKDLPQLHDRFVFPARGNDDNCFSGFGKCKARLDLATEALDPEFSVAQWTLHDLRRTASTGMASLGTPPHVVERVLNHTSGTFGGVAGIYNRFEYVDEMRDALNLWEAHILALEKTT